MRMNRGAFAPLVPALAVLALSGCAATEPAPAARSESAPASAPAASSGPEAPPRPRPERPSAALATLQGPQLTPGEASRFIAGLCATPLEHRVRMADTLWRCGMADTLLPPHLWVYVQRLGGRDMDSGLLTEMGFGFHLSYTHFAEPVVFHFVEELRQGTAWHKFEIDWFLQYVTLQFEEQDPRNFRNPGWVQKRANQWLEWIARHEHESRMEWAMQALRERPEAQPGRLFQVLEDVTGLKPFPTKVDPQDAADVAKRRDHWLAWWEANRVWLYWFEEATGPVLQSFPAWWNSTAGKAEREKGLYRVDVEAKAAGRPTREYRREHTWR